VCPPHCDRLRRRETKKASIRPPSSLDHMRIRCRSVTATTHPGTMRRATTRRCSASMTSIMVLNSLSSFMLVTGTSAAPRIGIVDGHASRHVSAATRVNVQISPAESAVARDTQGSGAMFGPPRDPFDPVGNQAGDRVNTKFGLPSSVQRVSRYLVLATDHTELPTLNTCSVLSCP
jgi:hypothetical protein